MCVFLSRIFVFFQCVSYVIASLICLIYEVWVQIFIQNSENSSRLFLFGNCGDPKKGLDGLDGRLLLEANHRIAEREVEGVPMPE